MNLNVIKYAMKSLLPIVASVGILSGCSGNDPKPDPPAAPSGLTGNAVGTFSVQLGWRDNSDNEDRFVIYRSISGPFEEAASVDADRMGFTDDIQVSCVEATYFVVAVNDGGQSAPSNRIVVPLLCVNPDSLQ
jgi:hypothetical protein